MNLSALIAEAKSIILISKDAALSAEQSARLAVLNTEIKAAQANEATIREGEALQAGIKAAGAPVRDLGDDAPAKSLGEHFVKTADFTGYKASNTRGLSAPEFKAAGPTLVGTAQVNDIDRTVVAQTRTTPSVIGLLNPGVLSGNGLTYRVELPVEGSVAAVAEGVAKARVTYTFEERREGISTVAGYTELSDEMLEDLDYVASEINGNLLVDLDIERDRQVLNGDGVGQNVKGILHRDGVLTVASASKDDNIDALHRASTLTSIASGREADALVIHPLDYEALILAKDKNGTYLGAGPFVAAVSKSVWALPAIVTPAIPQGTALVGAFKTASALVKGGTKVKSTDSHGDHFIEGITTIVAQARLGLKVPKPAAFAVVTFSATVAA